MDALSKSRGNSKELPTAYDVAQKTVLPNRRSMRDVAAMAALMKSDGHYYSFGVERDAKRYQSAGMEMEVSGTRVTDMRTLETWAGSSVVITTGGLDDVCRLTEKSLPDPADVWKNFYVGDILSISKFVEEKFELGPWRLADLTEDDRYLAARERTRSAEREHTEYAHAMIEENQRLLVQLHMMRAESTSFLVSAGKLVYDRLIEHLAKSGEPILDLLEPCSPLEDILEEAYNIGISPRTSVLAPGMEKAFYDNLIKAGLESDISAFSKLSNLWRRAAELGIGIDKWRLQNAVWGMLEDCASEPPDALLEFAGELGFALPGR
jgi:hypothetical protein